MKKETIWNRDFILLLAVNAFVFISMHMLSTTIANFTMSLNGTETLAGIVAGVFSVSSLLSRPVCGVLVDRMKKKILYLGSLAVIFVSLLGYSISGTITMAILFRLLHGVGWGFATTIGMTMAADTAPESKIGECTSVYGLANVLAMAVAPNLGNYLSSKYNYSVMFLSGAAAVFVALMLLLPVRSHKISLEKKRRGFSWSSLAAREALFPATSLFLYGMAYNAITTFLVAHAKGEGISNPGLFFTVYSVCILFVRLVSGKIVDRKGPEYILIPGFCFFAGCLFLLSKLHSITMLVLAAICLGFGYSGNLSTLMAVSFKRTERSRHGSVSSTINIGMDLGTGLGATVAGVISERLGYGAMYATLIIPVAMALALFLADQACFKNKTAFYRERIVEK